MSSQFSYELDERQIRLTLQDAEAEYDESLWNKFDSLSVVQSRTSSISNFMPSINISISRSVIVPVLFIALIGGLSAMLFSFVDFKKKGRVEKEIPLVANPDNFRKSESNTEKTLKPVTMIASVKTSIDTSSKVTATPSVTAEPHIAIPSEIKKENSVTLTGEVPVEAHVKVSTVVKKETAYKQVKKKKIRKLRPEVLPVINASPNLNEGVTEPELDLK